MIFLPVLTRDNKEKKSVVVFVRRRHRLEERKQTVPLSK